MFWIALRFHVYAMLGWGGFFALFLFLGSNGYAALAGSSPSAHLNFARGIAGIGEQTSILIPAPDRVDTMGGYLQWFFYGYVPIFFSIWAMVAGTAVLRGEEERGLLEQWLATGLPRWRLVLERLLAFAVMMVAAISLAGGFAVLGALVAGQRDLSPGGVLLQGIAEVAPALAIFSLGLIASSLFATRRNALGTTAIVFIVLLLLNGYSRKVEWLRPIRWISPFAYSDRSNAMVPDGHLDLAATLAVTVGALALAGLAAWLLSRRDLGSSLVRGPEGEPPALLRPSRNPLLRLPVLPALWDQRVGLAVWSLGLFFYGLVEMGTVKPFVSFFQQQTATPLLAAQEGTFGVNRADPIAGFVGGTVMLNALVFLSAYAITQVSRWASDDNEGRLEMVLSAGVPRWRVVAERVAALIAAAGLVMAATFAGLALGARANSISLDSPHLVLAVALVVPLALAFAALGSALAAFRPRVAMVGTTALVLVSYMVPLFGFTFFVPRTPPDWFLNLSLFHLYGLPLTDGVNWNGLYALLALTAGGLAVTLVALQRREVGR